MDRRRRRIHWAMADRHLILLRKITWSGQNWNFSSKMNFVRSNFSCFDRKSWSGLPRASNLHLLRERKNGGIASKWLIGGRALWQIQRHENWQKFMTSHLRRALDKDSKCFSYIDRRSISLEKSTSGMIETKEQMENLKSVCTTQEKLC